ncbi:MAG: hypothetical protein HC897_20520 [Thermoanaerobaculia bacterium]|nr:hypothetical protein [Thermoanaerobaculia bacterium]
MNPYNWRGNRPQVEVERSGIDAVALDLKRGGSGVLLAGRGMGKSVFLRQVHARLGAMPGVVPVFFPGPPEELTVHACVRTLARRLGVEPPEPFDTQEVIETALAMHADKAIVLIYDELDRYAQGSSTPADAPGRHFFNGLEVMRRNHEPRLGILAAGSIGVFLFRDVLGSSFIARADGVRISPFDREQIRELARAFSERGAPLTEPVLDAVAMASGGVPALVTYGLESLWPVEKPAEVDVAEAYAAFQIRHREFLRDFQKAFADPDLSEAPRRVLELIHESGGLASHEQLRRACQSDGVLRLRFDDALDLLQAAGLIRLDGSMRTDPIQARPVASILTLPDVPSRAPDVRRRLCEDLERLLSRMHAAGADFFRPAKGKELVPEVVFSTYLALGFDLLGWQVEREAQLGAGRTDLKLRAAGTGGLAVVEVKIWGRRHADVHHQVESYWASGVVAGAVVMLTDHEISDWPQAYRSQCLTIEGVEAVPGSEPRSPIRAQFAASSTTPDGMLARIDHFLMRIPRRS